MSDSKSNKPEASIYRSTLNMPDTPFPMRGDLPKREPDTLARWESEGLYAQLRAHAAGRPRFGLCSTTATFSASAMFGGFTRA